MMEKLKIAVCDDEAGDLAQLIALVGEYDTECMLDIQVYSNSAELLQAADVDIVLMDIEMPAPNGFEAAKKLKARKDPPVIIFTTKSNAYALKGYGIAIRYLQKPLQEKPFYEAMDAAIGEAIAHRLTFEVNETTYAIRLQEIVYIEIYGHYASIHAGKDAYRIRSSLKEIVAKLPRGSFGIPHKSYVVNLEHVRSATNSEILLDNGTRIPVSRRKAAEFSQVLYRFLGR